MVSEVRINADGQLTGEIPGELAVQWVMPSGR